MKLNSCITLLLWVLALMTIAETAEKLRKPQLRIGKNEKSYLAFYKNYLPSPKRREDKKPPGNRNPGKAVPQTGKKPQAYRQPKAKTASRNPGAGSSGGRGWDGWGYWG